MQKLMLSLLAALPLLGGPLSKAPAPPDAAKIEQRIARDVAWFQATLPAAYERAGAKNPKWDAAATEALTAAAQLWSDDPKRPGNEHERAWQASRRAIKAGCDDAMVRYVHSRMYTVAALESTDEAARLAREAAAALDRSPYLPLYKLVGHARAAEAIIADARARNATSAPGAAEQLDAAAGYWPKVAESLDVPHGLLLGAFQTYLDKRRELGGDRKLQSAPILAAFEKTAKKTALLPLLRTRYLVDYAWDARGGKTIDKTTETQVGVFEKRLDEAAAEAKKLIAIDPASPSIAPMMFAIELGSDGDRNRMESWFRYGVAVDPANSAPWYARLHHLEPRWHGSPQEMLEVGAEALATKQWASRVPFVLIFAHHQLAEEREDYFDAAVCHDVRNVYGPYLERYPDAHYERSGYAFLLYRCGDLPGAHREIQRAGAERRLGPFVTRAKFDQVRVEASLAANAGKAKKLERAGKQLTVGGFHRAITLGETKNVALYLEAGMPPDVADERGVTALHVAAGEDDPKILELLLKAGSDVNAQAKNGDTPLLEAAEDGTPKHVELLIKAGAEVNARNDSDETPVHRAAKRSDATILNQLIKAGGDVDARSRSGAAPLHHAVDSNSTAAVKALLAAGANPNVRNAADHTPLSAAKQFSRSPEIVAALENAKPSASPKPLPAGDPAEQLKKMGIRSADAETLIARVKAKDSRAVALLLAAGVKPDVRDHIGRPPLWNAIEDRDLEMVKTLLAGGADPNDPGKHVRPEFDSQSSLAMLAVDNREPEILRALIAAGTKVDITNEYKHNALMSACMFGQAEMVRILVEAGANVNAADSAGTPVLWMAVKGGSVDAVKTLLDAGAKLGAKKALILEVAAQSGNDEIRALIGKAAGTAVAAQAPPPRPTPKPASQKKHIDAKELYAAALPIARKWQEDADLFDLTTLRDAELGLDGRSHNWVIGFYSRSAQKLLQITWNDGKLSQYDRATTPLRPIPVNDETILDTKMLSDMAVEAGASRLTDRGIRPTVGLSFNRVPLWYFNYSDPETKKNVMTIAINAQNGEIVLNHAR